jgi:hypothetical protein
VARELRRLVEPDVKQQLEEYAAQFDPFGTEEFLWLLVSTMRAVGLTTPMPSGVDSSSSRNLASTRFRDFPFPTLPLNQPSWLG